MCNHITTCICVFHVLYENCWANTYPLYLYDADSNDTSEFHIHSVEGKVWYFDASNPEEMMEWVKAIEAQIKKFLEDSVLPKRNVRTN